MSPRKTPPRHSRGKGRVDPHPPAPDPTRPKPVDLEQNIRVALVRGRKDFLRYFRRRLGTAQDAEDALHDFFLRVLQASHLLADPARLNAWLSRVLKSTLIDRYRRNAARERLMADFAALATTVADEEKTSECECVYLYLPMLKTEFGEVLRRADMCEQPHAAIARDLGLSVGNVAVRVHRARKAMRELLLSLCQTCPTEGFFRCGCEPGRSLPPLQPRTGSPGQRGAGLP